jgi:hypothetical protein
VALSAEPLFGEPCVSRLRPLAGGRHAGLSIIDEGGREVRLPVRLHQSRARGVITIRIILHSRMRLMLSWKRRLHRFRRSHPPMSCRISPIPISMTIRILRSTRCPSTSCIFCHGRSPLSAHLRARHVFRGWCFCDGWLNFRSPPKCPRGTSNGQPSMLSGAADGRCVVQGRRPMISSAPPSG